MKVFEQKQQDGSRKLMGTMTTVEEAVEVTLKTEEGTSSTFDFAGQYHYVAPGSFAVNGTDAALGMYIGETRVAPPSNIDFENEVVDFTVTAPTKVTYTAGDALDLTGMVVKLVREDGSEETTTSYTTSPANGTTLTTEMTSVTVSVTGLTKTKSFEITVNAPATITRTVDMNGGTAGGESICVDEVQKGLDWVPDLWYSQNHSTWTIPEGKAWNGVTTVKDDESTKISHMVLDSDCTFYVLWKDA